LSCNCASGSGDCAEHGWSIEMTLHISALVPVARSCGSVCRSGSTDSHRWTLGPGTRGRSWTASKNWATRANHTKALAASHEGGAGQPERGMSKRSLPASLVGDEASLVGHLQSIRNGLSVLGTAREPDEPVAVPLDRASESAELRHHIPAGIVSRIFTHPRPERVVASVLGDASGNEGSLFRGHHRNLVSIVDVIGEQRNRSKFEPVLELRWLCRHTFPNLFLISLNRKREPHSLRRRDGLRDRNQLSIDHMTGSGWVPLVLMSHGSTLWQSPSNTLTSVGESADRGVAPSEAYPPERQDLPPVGTCRQILDATERLPYG
jgi:hypothetical protein